MDDRRNYFRLQDKVALEVRPLDPARATDPMSPLADSGTHRFRLLSELENLQAESMQALAEITRTHPKISQFLRLQERKIRLIAEAAVDRDDQPLPDNEQEVSLSAGGLSFSLNRPMAAGSYLAVRMLLLPERAGLLLKSRVIECRAVAELYRVRVEFLHVSDADRAIISRHLMQTEARARAVEVSS